MKILWAVDAFNDLPELQRKSDQLLRRVGKCTQIQVDPVYVLSPEQLGVAIEFSEHWTHKYAPLAKKSLMGRLSDVGIPGMSQPQVLVHERASLKGDVEMLATHAKAHSYDLIVAGTHARRGLKRMVMGSFAEELLMQSAVPVLILREDTMVTETTDQKQMKVLVAHDLNKSELSFLSEVFKFTKRLGAQLTLLNVIPRPLEVVFQSGVYLLSEGWVTVPAYSKNEQYRQKDQAARIQEQARLLGIECKVIIDDLSPSVVESILSHSQEHKADIIAMSAQSGPVASAFIGSITRQIVRTAPVPVWVYRDFDSV